MIEWIEIQENRDLMLPHQWQARVEGHGSVAVLSESDQGWIAYVAATDGVIYELFHMGTDSGELLELDGAKACVEDCLQRHGWRKQ